MKVFPVVIFMSGLATLALTPLVKRLAFVVGAVDHVGGRRKVHEREVPRLGGVAIFFPVMLSLVLEFWIGPVGGRRLESNELFGILVASGTIFRNSNSEIQTTRLRGGA